MTREPPKIKWAGAPVSNVWAYLAVRDGYIGGMCAPEPLGQRETAKFVARFVRAGFDIIACPNQAEYLAKLKEYRVMA